MCFYIETQYTSRKSFVSYFRFTCALDQLSIDYISMHIKMVKINKLHRNKVNVIIDYLKRLAF